MHVLFIHDQNASVKHFGANLAWPASSLGRQHRNHMTDRSSRARDVFVHVNIRSFFLFLFLLLCIFVAVISSLLPFRRSPPPLINTRAPAPNKRASPPVPIYLISFFFSSRHTCTQTKTNTKTSPHTFLHPRRHTSRVSSPSALPPSLPPTTTKRRPSSHALF